LAGGGVLIDPGGLLWIRYWRAPSSDPPNDWSFIYFSSPLVDDNIDNRYRNVLLLIRLQFEHVVFGLFVANSEYNYNIHTDWLTIIQNFRAKKLVHRIFTDPIAICVHIVQEKQQTINRIPTLQYNYYYLKHSRETRLPHIDSPSNSTANRCLLYLQRYYYVLEKILITLCCDETYIPPKKE